MCDQIQEVEFNHLQGMFFKKGHEVFVCVCVFVTAACLASLNF